APKAIPSTKSPTQAINAQRQTTPHPEAKSAEIQPQQAQDSKIPKEKPSPHNTKSSSQKTLEEQAAKILRQMQKARSLDQLKQEWGKFQKIRPELSQVWIDRIAHTKEQRKDALAA
ncbi:MAG: hypothetical protein AAGJ35_08415, partial [Myxococcota bacterium]